MTSINTSTGGIGRAGSRELNFPFPDTSDRILFERLSTDRLFQMHSRLYVPDHRPFASAYTALSALARTNGGTTVYELFASTDNPALRAEIQEAWRWAVGTMAANGIRTGRSAAPRRGTGGSRPAGGNTRARGEGSDARSFRSWGESEQGGHSGRESRRPSHSFSHGGSARGNDARRGDGNNSQRTSANAAGAAAGSAAYDDIYSVHTVDSAEAERIVRENPGAAWGPGAAPRPGRDQQIPRRPSRRAPRHPSTSGFDVPWYARFI